MHTGILPTYLLIANCNVKILIQLVLIGVNLVIY